MNRITSYNVCYTKLLRFIDALADYQADFALLPEFFNVPLMGEFPLDTPTAEAMRLLASEFTPPVCEAIARMAVHYNINIIAGSLPQMEDGEMYNVAYLFRRDGTQESQYKLHITPTEHRLWNMKGGDQLKVFNTDAGKIGILICYDCEFVITSYSIHYTKLYDVYPVRGLFHSAGGGVAHPAGPAWLARPAVGCARHPAGDAHSGVHRRASLQRQLV